jgi:hypothetical protein
MLQGVVFLASLILDFAIYSTVVKFKSNFADLKFNVSGDYFQSANLGSLVGANGSGLIYYLWGMIRDFINIVIFLIIIYSAVRSMFEGFEDTRNRFISLLVFSIIINFSLLFVQIAIDISNILALQAYTLAVKPGSTQDFYQFRTSGSGVKSLGQYIMESIDMEKLYQKKFGEQVANSEIADKQNTFMFQLGRMVLYIGIIYVFLYLAGMLFSRAIIFLLAMILAPLIAVDLYFSYFGKYSSKMKDFADKVRSKTEKIRGDFYEGLIKGPLLIFFIFLIGVLSESIFTQGAMTNLTSTLTRMNDVKNVDQSLINSISVFFKFAIFLLLSLQVFKYINSLTQGFTTSGMIGGWANSFANFAFGRGLGALGAVGRNTIGRAASSTRNPFGNTIAGLNKTFSGLQSSNWALIRGIGNVGTRATRGISEGTYDVRNSSTAKSFAGGIIKATEAQELTKNVNLGKGAEGGYKARLGAKIDAATKNVNDIKKEAGENVMVTADQISKASKSVNLDINGAKLSLAEYDEILKDPSKMAAIIKPADLEKFKIGFAQRDSNPNILNEIEKARNTAEDKAKNEEIKKRKGEVTKAAETGKITGTNLAEDTGNRLVGSLNDVRMGVRRQFVAESNKAKETTEKEKLGKFSIVSETKQNLETALAEVNSGIKFAEANPELFSKSRFAVDTPEYLEAEIRENSLNELRILKDKLRQNITDLAIPSGNIKPEARMKVVDDFSKNNDLRNQIIKNKNDSSDILSSLFDKGGTNERFINEVKDLRTAAKQDFDVLDSKKSGLTRFTPDRKRREIIRDWTAAEQKVKSYDRVLEKAYETAKKIGESATRTEEKIKASFEPKPASPPADAPKK